MQRPWADQIAANIAATELQETLTTIRQIVATAEAEEAALGN